MNNIYIYFASEDNQAVEGMEEGWVASFQVFLKSILGQLTHQEINIKLMIADDVANVETLKNDGLLICVLSPAFVNSGGIIQDFGVVYNAFESNSEKVRANVRHIFKVVKSPVSLERQPTGLQKVLDYKLYHLVNETGAVEEFRNFEEFFTSEAEKSFWLSMADLTYDILDTIKEHEFAAKEEEAQNDYVYLSEVGYDLAMERITIKRDLQRHGYKVLPDRALPRNKENLEKRIKEDLEKSMFSIHLFGEDYGEEVENEEYSSIVLQNKMAADYALELSKEGASSHLKFPFNRLVWIHSELRYLDERQKYYLDKLQRELSEQHGAEILLTRIEDFKTSVFDQLKAKRPIKDLLAKTAQRDSENLSIYLITDKRDVEETQPLVKWLEDQKYKVLQPDFDAKTINSRLIHQKYLNSCDALIIFFGKAKEEWLLTKLQDVLKAPGMGRDNPLLNKAIFTDSEVNVERLNNVRLQNEHHREALVILNKGEFSPNTLQSFLQELKSGV